ncbi:TIGR02452 family protein [Tahibacter caeni]|uniref:TIGR02452 family protein n=1 Tax=Tahibacter caeni TaxID=1453545 RepID=UPI0021492BE5|nr:TIGR02452 family protein [Tahibacter caeni]
MSRPDRKLWAEQTLEILERGRYTAPLGETVELAAAITACRAATRLFSPSMLQEYRDAVLAAPSPGLATRIDVVNETTLQGIARLIAETGDGDDLAVLNFASARNPGGGFLGGAQAQEESLARSSALYASQLRAPAFYDDHRRSSSLLYSDAMILSPHCPVFRYDDGQLRDRAHAVSFITSAAPNAGAIRQQRREREQRDIASTLRRRAECVLALAAVQGYRRLVLGAWGCGVFGNDPHSVAAVFASLLRGAWQGRFAQVAFSVLDTSPQQATLRAFRDLFAATPGR